MPLILFIIVILLGNWFFSEILVFLPIHLFNWLESLLNLVLLGIVLLIVGWLFGEP